MKATLGIYGNVKIPRIWCKKCKSFVLVIDGNRACCGHQLTEDLEITKKKRMTQTELRRRSPGKKERKRLLEQFENACAYCEKTFNGWTMYHGEWKKVKLEFDHQVPWAYNQNNTKENFLPSCSFCNGWKGSLMFKTMEEVKIYVATKWEEDKKKYPNIELSSM